MREFIRELKNRLRNLAINEIEAEPEDIAYFVTLIEEDLINILQNVVERLDELESEIDEVRFNVNSLESEINE